MRRYPVAGGGIVVALVGFVLTRFTVAIAAAESPDHFLFSGVIPLALGLILTAFGVFLAVSTYDRHFVWTIAVWCVIGTVTMALFVVLTILGTAQDMALTLDVVREQAILSNFLIGGAIGGTLTGVYAGRNREQRRDLRQQANRLEILNRILRDRVINAATAIVGHAALLEEDHRPESVAVVDNKADSVIETVESVKLLSRTAQGDAIPRTAVDLRSVLSAELDALAADYPEASYTLTGETDVAVRADDRLGSVFRELLENAVLHSTADTPEFDVSMDRTGRYGRVRIEDTGPGLPESQRRLLEDGDIAEYDDPTTGFGLNVVRLLLESYEGDCEVTVGEDGSTIDIYLPLAESKPVETNGLVDPAGVPVSKTLLATAVALVAGMTMAGAMSLFDGDLLAIGMLYGIDSSVITVITHEFHSVVFGLIYAAVLVTLATTVTNRLFGRIGIGIALGLVLWLFAAGLVMPIWLLLVGIGAPIPNLTLASLVGHVVWGTTMGAGYHVGERFIDADPTG